MKLSTSDLANLLLALGILLVAAHLVGGIFARIRQPRSLGEVAGGLLFGPTFLGHFAPSVYAWIFPTEGSTPVVVAATAQIGLLLLMFMTGTEVKRIFQRGYRKTVTAIFLTGMILPFIAGIGLVGLIDERRFWGPQANFGSFLLIFAIAMAVTSIPVISRIMHDLGILDTAFARIVLGVAVLEDMVLYVVLAIAVGAAGGSQGSLFGLPAVLRIQGGTAADMAYHVASTVGFLVVSLSAGPSLYRWLGERGGQLIQRATPVAYRLTFMLFMTLVGLALGVEAFFGALVAGIVVGTTRGRRSEADDATQAITSFSLAFFIPIYFAVIGFSLDLIHAFSVSFFLVFLVVACGIKSVSVYIGARGSGETNRSSWNLAVAMNARGGPGIVVASVAFAAGIINQSFYAVLVLVAVVTSLVAGSWLERIPRDRLLERPTERPAARPSHRGEL